jgi:hypothetical protein
VDGLVIFEQRLLERHQLEVHEIEWHTVGSKQQAQP